MNLPSTKPFIQSILLAAMGVATLEAENKRLEYEDADVFMRLVLRTPTQLSAFYQGREFSQAAIDRILETCFTTPIIKNKVVDVLWLELDLWRFSVAGRPIQRIGRDHWRKAWQDVGLPQAHRSTFGWTLLPEVRDLRIDESVGGSVIIPWQSQPFTLTAVFPRGADRRSEPKTIVFEGIQCAKDKQ